MRQLIFNKDWPVNGVKDFILFQYRGLLVFLAVCHILHLFDVSMMLINIGLLAYLTVRMLHDFNVRSILIHLLPLLAMIQCLLLPSIIYYLEQFQIEHLKWIVMAVPSQEYFEYAFPAIMVLIVGINAPVRWIARKKTPIKEFESDTVSGYVSAVFLITGLAAIVMRNIMAIELQFFFYLLSNLVYVALCYTLISSQKFDIPIRIISVVLLLLSALGVRIGGFDLVVSSVGGSFFDLIFWSIYFALFVKVRYPQPMRTKLIFVSLGVIAVITMQSIKPSFRAATDEENNSSSRISNVGLAVELIYEHLTEGKIFSEATARSLLIRLNQGGIVAFAMHHVPKNEPFAEGETIVEGTLASLVPRILWPDKPKAGGSSKLERFTGFEPRESVSANIGILGEAYVNYGKMGGILFMFLYGVFFYIFNAILVLISSKKPTLIIWFPLLYLAAVMTETDVLTVLNHLIKTGILVLAIFIATHRLFRFRI